MEHGVSIVRPKVIWIILDVFGNLRSFWQFSENCRISMEFLGVFMIFLDFYQVFGDSGELLKFFENFRELPRIAEFLRTF